MGQLLIEANDDLRAPLTEIGDLVDRYRQGAESDGDLVIDRIAQESVRMRRMLDELLTLTRMDVLYPFEWQPVDMGVLADLVLRDVHVPEAHNRLAALTIEGSDAIEVVGDRIRLRLALSNLIACAVAAAEPGAAFSVRIIADDRVVRVEVTTNGPATTADRVDAGLGLAVVQSIVAEHAGAVWVDQEPGRSGTFTVELPRAVTPCGAGTPGGIRP
ncbi:MAG: two-component sensor histidine kinase [Nocardia sp.]|uniref:sensor histidine kinase n=1 Tax=Nocardia sp. TaxID=1821 RepID=UPI00262543DA|nr:HAMP domain-containing sensor histidine kinase [Nocardia sp.]MCU1639827.1 two-component sensor histidine kinase [Nocardia sp.]